jgi:hypothetical protein
MTKTDDGVSEYVRQTLRDPTPEEWPAIRARQVDFLKTFGDFDGKIFNSFWVGVSPDGLFTGFYFRRDDGTEMRVALGSEMMPLMVQSIMIATQMAAERAKMAFQTAGQA